MRNRLPGFRGRRTAMPESRPVAACRDNGLASMAGLRSCRGRVARAEGTPG
ncbi:hypothetical protein ACQVP2_16665 [Methylobacterium aquaticum]|uniref:hypothetical protein n=1 Tax=Methylobacterium aquaticum TaxID=270351 RepID=UPI003D17210B